MEDAFQQAQAVLGDGYAWTGVLMGLILLLAKLLTTLGKTLEFHDRYFVGKRLNRLKALRLGIQEDKALVKYLDDAIALESFHIASGISTSAEKMSFLIRLSGCGRWNRPQIQAIAKFLEVRPESSCPEIHITKMDKFGAALGLALGIFLILLGMFYFVLFFFSSEPLGLPVGALVLGAFIVAARLFATDFINYLIAKRALAYLRMYPLQDEASVS